MDKKSRDMLAFMACSEAIINDPEWIELKKERDRKIARIERKFNRKCLRIENEYLKKYGLFGSGETD